MGNCLVMEERLIKVMKIDGKVLEYRVPTKAHQVLSDFAGHAISDNPNPAVQHLKPDANLVAGQLYYLLPLAAPPPPPPVKASVKKRVRFAIPEKESTGEESSGGSSEVVMRVKLVISKKELEALLSKEGFSVSDLVSYQVPHGRESRADQKDHGQSDLATATSAAEDDDVDGSSRSWKPVLGSISEN